MKKILLWVAIATGCILVLNFSLLTIDKIGYKLTGNESITGYTKIAKENEQERLAEEARLKEEQEKKDALFNVLAQCGFDTEDVKLQEDGFYYNGEDGKYTQLDDGTVVKVKYADIIVYEDGIDDDIIVDINKLPLDIEDKTILQTWAEEDVEKYLNYPETAKFGNYNEMQFDFDEQDNWFVSGYVTAENAFGVPSKYKFVCSYAMENFEDYQATFNGCELYE